jgi:alpha-tubulin suppressor-like RCC1 family protein
MTRFANTIAAGLLLTILGCGEETQAPRDLESAPGIEPALATAAAALSFEQVSAGGAQTCGVTTDQKAYCWGYAGLVGDGSRVERHRPAAVAGARRWLLVSSGQGHVCGVTTERSAYCWGSNTNGVLGDGTTADRLVPVAVLGGLRFRDVSAGVNHTCGVSYPDNRAYCWGYNGEGELGDGTTTWRSTPVAVAAGTLRFRQVQAGNVHTCGVTTGNQIYCWGDNTVGQVGDSSTANKRTKPTLIAGGRQYRQVDAGWNHNCAVTLGNKAFCWGNGREGQLGNGRTYLSFWPRAVAGGLSFERVTAGAIHSCGETTLNRAYCWGYNADGNVGDGTHLNRRLTPVAVTGGHFFSQVSAGGMSTCGRTDAAVAYCWGLNQYGQLGDGTTTNRWSPTAVLGPS